MVRPGLFLVRGIRQMAGGGRVSVFVAAVALFAAAMVPSPVFAEQAVGLEAQGVDPWAALRNGQNLDVRDELGRPVSAKVIQRQLAAASVQAVEAKAAVSRLPKARVIFRLLEQLSSLTGFWGLPFPLNPARGAWALVRPSRGVEKPAAAFDFVRVIALALVLGCCRKAAVLRSSLQKTVALRC